MLLTEKARAEFSSNRLRLQRLGVVLARLYRGQVRICKSVAQEVALAGWLAPFSRIRSESGDQI